jgi:hypothetical protein
VRTSWIRALILVVVLVGGVITPVAPVGDARAAGPSGFVTIPDANVHEDLPVDQSLPISKEDLEGSVMVSDNASTTEVVVTNSERAEGYLGNGTSVGGGSLALVIQDDTNHAGREVAIPADAVKGAIGRIPEAVHGTHEDGSEWTSQVRAESGLLIFEVPHFSSNTVTFSGEVSVTGTYADGSSVNYEVSSLDSVSNFSANVIGEMNNETDTHSYTLSDGESSSFDVSGNSEPGPANVTVTDLNPESVSTSASSGSTSSHTETISSSWAASDTFYDATIWVNADFYTEVDVYLIIDGSSTLIADNVIVNGDLKEISNYQNVNPSIPSGATVKIQVDQVGDNPFYAEDTWSVQGTEPSSADVTVDGVTNNISPGGSASLDLTTGSKSVSASLTKGSADVSIKYEERTVTQDPSLDVNGHTTAHSGTLSDGESATLSTNSSWIQDGTNRINVSVGDGSLSTDAPTPKVALDYRHEASDEISADYTTEGWTERYNVSHTYASQQADPVLTVPYQGDITTITRLEEKVDGGSWGSVPSSRYSLSDGELTVQLDDGDGDGDIDAGTEISVRTTGRYVKPVNGEITITDPVLPGEDQDVKMRIDSKGSGFYVDLSGVTNPGLRYTYSESWSSPEAHMIVTASGEKRLKFPNAGAGATTRVTLAPITVTPETGDAKVSVADPDEPTITMGAGSSSGDDVTITYLEAPTGTTYQLYSTSRDRIVAKEEADAGKVSFVEDDSAESLMINTTSSGGGGGGMFADTSAAADYGVERPVLVMGALAALVIGLVWATGRTGLRGRSRWALVVVVSLGLGLISLESLYPGAISRRIGEGLGGIFSQLGTVVPIAGIAAVAITGYVIVSWWQSRKAEASTPDTKVTFSLGDKKK